MEMYKDEGLNFVPQLNVSNHIAAHLRAHRVRALYNGNYEGDTTMFYASTPIKTDCKKEQSDNDSYADSDDDNDQREKMVYDAEATENISNAGGDGLETKPLTVCDKVLKSAMSNQQIQNAMAFIETLANNKYCKSFIESLHMIYLSMAWAFIFVFHKLLHFIKIDLMTLEHCTNYMRTITRHVLWWMTLSKSGDVLHFGRMVVAAPLVFVIAVIGLFISIYAALRVHLYACYKFIQSTAIWIRQV